MLRFMLIALVMCLIVSPLPAQNDTDQPVSQVSAWEKLVIEQLPTVWWRFSKDDPGLGISPGRRDPDLLVKGRLQGALKSGQPGTAATLFDAGNTATAFDGKTSVIKIADPGTDSIFDFESGDAITLEAWVKPNAIAPGQYQYIIGKGRTRNPGVASENQSFALRLEGKGDGAAVTFLFHSRDEKDRPGEYHRWSSTEVFPLDEHFHHVAVTYEFGRADSLRGYIDGLPVKGVWDLGGATSRAPLVDDDEVWIGSSMGVQPGSTFNGVMDEVVLYRQALPADVLKTRRIVPPPRATAPPMPESAAPVNAVLVELHEGLPDKSVWPQELPAAGDAWTEPAFAFFDVLPAYSDKGLRTDRSNPLILTARSRMALPAGKWQVLLRTLRFGRVYLDGNLIVETPVRNHRGDGHGAMYDLESKLAPGTRPLYPGSDERLAEMQLDGGLHEIRVEVYVGGQKRRLELGETSVSIARPGEPFKVLSPTLEIPLTDTGWENYERQRRVEHIALNQRRRLESARSEATYWQQRHAVARQVADAQPPIALPQVRNESVIHNDIDRFIQAQLEAAGLEPAPLADDWSFLRRLALDVIGTPPSPALVREFFALPAAERRSKIIDRLLNDPGWADNWVGYWQDVLAENPNVVNPTLNNTGPFRWWIHEAFLDNRPFDQFASELIAMEGSEYFGGPGGFRFATQNDAPNAAKAHIVSKAFLGFEMQCARCHDAPYHDFKQRDLFALAGMLNRAPESVPTTSTIPGGKSNSKLVAVTLKPGEPVAPVWPFGPKLKTDIPAGAIRRANDPREEFAARVTSPHNERFAEVMVNRVWHRYLGRGIVEPVDDWEKPQPSHPELLRWLSREFIRSGFDVKHVARLIFQSHTYQRQVIAGEQLEPVRLFATPTRRRLTAEQLVDSLFAIAGKDFRAGDMNIDVDGSRQFTQSLNMGIPRRAWMFSSPSNERDRPSLALPFAQPFVTLMETFGWRSSRQNPLTVREEASNVLQPAILANGVLGRRFTRLTDDSEFTRLALQDQPLEAFIDAVVQRSLTRPPTSEERALFAELLRDGYEARIVREELNKPAQPLLRTRTGVGWSNHLQPAASDAQTAAEERVRQGDPPTKKLTPAWRNRLEDMLWALMNSPEMVFVP